MILISGKLITMKTVMTFDNLSLFYVNKKTISANDKKQQHILCLGS